MEDRVANSTVFVPQAEVNEARTVVVHHTTAVLPYSFVTLGIVSPILGVRIPDVQKHAILGPLEIVHCHLCPPPRLHSVV